MAAELGTLRRNTAAIPSGLELTPASDVVNYELACNAYSEVRAEHPRHVDQATLQSREELLECAEEGLLFDIRVNGRWAGYVGATRNEDSLGLPAYVVKELVLAPEYRSRGYGPHLTTLLAQALPDDETVLVGTIHADNRGAMQAALAAGRVDIGGWFQIPLTSASCS